MALFVGAIFTTMAALNPMMAGAVGAGGAATVLYLLIAAVSFFFALYLYQFGDLIKKGVTFQNQEEINLAFGKLKLFFKLWGIFAIIYLSFMALFILIAVLGGAAAMMGR
ncbi:DUF5362 family protein [Mucilaginibacter sp. 10I4]|nr:DUF5362 family protein [Mucilaginibacter sp. 10I4]